MDIEAREPQEFQIGDSLYFIRQLPEFPPIVGNQAGQSYYLKYSLYSDQGAFMLSFVSVPGPGENLQMVLIDSFGIAPNALTPGIQASLDVGLYVLVGTAIGQAGMGAGGGTETHEVYRDKLKLTPNFNAGLPIDSQEGDDMKHYREADCLLCQLMKTYVVESDIQKVKLVREKSPIIRTERNFWKEAVRNRKMQEDCQNGRPNPAVIRTVFSILWIIYGSVEILSFQARCGACVIGTVGAAARNN